MNRTEAIRLIDAYCTELRRINDWDDDLTGLIDRIPERASEAKAMRWLGWMQGRLEGRQTYSRDEIKVHSRVITRAPSLIGPVLKLRGKYNSDALHDALDLCKTDQEATEIVGNILKSIADAEAAARLGGPHFTNDHIEAVKDWLSARAGSSKRIDWWHDRWCNICHEYESDIEFDKHNEYRPALDGVLFGSLLAMDREMWRDPQLCLSLSYSFDTDTDDTSFIGWVPHSTLPLHCIDRLVSMAPVMSEAQVLVNILFASPDAKDWTEWT